MKFLPIDPGWGSTTWDFGELPFGFDVIRNSDGAGKIGSRWKTTIKMYAPATLRQLRSRDEVVALWFTSSQTGSTMHRRQRNPVCRPRFRRAVPKLQKRVGCLEKGDIWGFLGASDSGDSARSEKSAEE